MPGRLPSWMDEGLEPTRHKSSKQESNIAKALKGRTTINSGATLGQNDVLTDFAEIEAKTTAKASFSVTVKDWSLLVEKCDPKKMPVLVIEYNQLNQQLAVIDFEDLKFLIELSNRCKI